MSSSRVNRTPAPLTANEKWMVLNFYRYFSGATSIDKQNKNMTLRKRVGLVWGLRRVRLGDVLSDWNQRNDGTFTPHQNLNLNQAKASHHFCELTL